MKTFNQLASSVITDINHFNAIQFDLHNFNHFLSTTPDLDKEYIHAVIDKALTEIYKHYENKNTKNSENHLENS